MERRLAAILVADMAGYSRLMERDEEGVILRQKAHRREIIELDREQPRAHHKDHRRRNAGGVWRRSRCRAVRN